MKLLAALVALPLLSLAACGDDRPATSHDELRKSHQNASGDAEKSFDKENPADPASMQAAPAKE